MPTDDTNATTPTRASKAIDFTRAGESLSRLTTRSNLERELARRNLTLPEDATDATLATTILIHSEASSQGDFSAWCVNLTIGADPPLPLTPTQLTDALAHAFPGAGVGQRHGPHYLCHARKGHLDQVRPGLVIGFAKRAQRVSKKPITTAPEQTPVETTPPGLAAPTPDASAPDSTTSEVVLVTTAKPKKTPAAKSAPAKVKTKPQASAPKL